MKKLLLLAALIGVYLFIQAEDKTTSPSSQYDIQDYTHLVVRGGVSVELYKEAKPTIDATIVKGRTENFVVKNVGDSLLVYFKSTKGISKNSSEQAKVKLGFNQLESINQSAGSSIRSDEEITAGGFKIVSSSGAATKLIINASEIKVNASSGSAINLEGSCNKIDASASSGAALSARKLIAAEAKVNANSGAAVTVHAGDRIQANASSGAAVRYAGDPAIKDIESSKYSGAAISQIK